uniref:Uncharacterized protein n=1 Tax=Physcomitrium patens TaxID=3218 RepID=A0A7I3Z3J2_PHYPA
MNCGSCIGIGLEHRDCRHQLLSSSAVGTTTISVASIAASQHLQLFDVLYCISLHVHVVLLIGVFVLAWFLTVIYVVLCCRRIDMIKGFEEYFEGKIKLSESLELLESPEVNI